MQPELAGGGGAKRQRAGRCAQEVGGDQLGDGGVGHDQLAVGVAFFEDLHRGAADIAAIVERALARRAGLKIDQLLAALFHRRHLAKGRFFDRAGFRLGGRRLIRLLIIGRHADGLRKLDIVDAGIGQPGMSQGIEKRRHGIRSPAGCGLRRSGNRLRVGDGRGGMDADTVGFAGAGGFDGVCFGPGCFGPGVSRFGQGTFRSGQGAFRQRCFSLGACRLQAVSQGVGCLDGSGPGCFCRGCLGCRGFVCHPLRRCGERSRLRGTGG